MQEATGATNVTVQGAPVSESGVAPGKFASTQPVATASSCYIWYWNYKWENVFGGVLTWWYTYTHVCSSGSTITSETWYPTVWQVDWGWSFNQWITRYGQLQNSSTWLDSATAQFYNNASGAY